MLPVTVELKSNVVVRTMGKSKTGLDRPANAEVDRKLNHPSAVGLGNCRCRVLRAIVDNEEIGVWDVLMEVVENSRQGGSLVVGRDDRQHSSPAAECGCDGVRRRHR